MELKLINAQGQAASTVTASDALFGREFNEALVHQVVVAYQANARAGNRKQKDREEVHHSTKKAVPSKGNGPCACGYDILADLARWWPDFPEHAGREFHPEGQPEDVSRRPGRDPFPVGSRRQAGVIDDFAIEAPKTRLFAQKLKAMGLDSVLLVTDSLDDNLALASRNLPNVLVLEAHQADPVSLVRFPKVIFTKGAVTKIEEMLA
jgi:large subunit ribosomal protein L4